MTTTNNSNNDTLEIVPLQTQKVKLEEGKHAGHFVDLNIETEPKRLGTPRKDLIVTVRLTDALDGQPVTMTHCFNLLPGKRGKSHFKNCMSSYLKREVKDTELASFSKSAVVNKPVICKYEKNKLGNAVIFVTYLPTK